MQISEATITELQNAMQKREITAKELALCYLSRIAAVDKGDGGLNAVLEINPDALAVAERLDRLRQGDTVLGPLHGIPVMLKDNICTGDKMHTSAGSVALEENYSPYDAALVQRLRNSGAVILGKTNMTEFANSMAKGMPSGYSSRGGQTLNPYDRGADPSGSSTGSAVAVSANLCAAAVGTETCGSIISPAQHNGVVGLKPTLGLVSGHGVIPISHTLDTAGPLARTVADAAILLGALAEADETGVQTHSYTGALGTSALKGLRVGIFRMFTEDCDAEQLTMSENVVAVLRENGAACVEIPRTPSERGSCFPLCAMNSSAI